MVGDQGAGAPRGFLSRRDHAEPRLLLLVRSQAVPSSMRWSHMSQNLSPSPPFSTWKWAAGQIPSNFPKFPKGQLILLTTSDRI